ncbi:MAG: amidoligase family protein, partial [Tateyamaria sp.]
MSDQDAKLRYPKLPIATTESGERRRIGVEVEFAGLGEKDAAQVFVDTTDGSLRQEGTSWVCETEAFGACTFYLDTRFRDDLDQRGGEAALQTARLVVPVELVSDPFDPALLPKFDRALAQLRAAGAEGTGKSMAFGFGVHLNVEIASEAGGHIARVACSYALLEPLLREMVGLDLSRRIMPFVEPFPQALVTELAANPRTGLETLAHTVLAQTTSRNHGLDLLPILSWGAESVVTDRVPPETKIAPRPAYHYRLPECRI